MAQPAREEFARRYAPAIRAYVGALVHDREEAEELAQGFYTDVILSGRLLQRYDPARGAFRPFLKQALRNYVVSAARSRGRQKRNPQGEVVRPDQQSAGWEPFGPVTRPPEAAFHEAWVRSLLGEALTRVRAICAARDQIAHFEIFAGRYLSRSDEPPSWGELGRRWQLDGKTARSRADTVASHFRAVLAELVTPEVGTGASAGTEIRRLLALF
jgi:DNA-directed RNA polymerase specialized sigma24 family protein